MLSSKLPRVQQSQSQIQSCACTPKFSSSCLCCFSEIDCYTIASCSGLDETVLRQNLDLGMVGLGIPDCDCIYIQGCKKQKTKIFLEGRMSDQVTILIGHNIKLFGHDSPYRPISWHLEQAFWFEENLFSAPKGC